MENYDKNIDFFKHLEADFEKSEHDLWGPIEEQTSSKKEAKSFSLKWLKFAVAASVAILAALTLFLRLYTTEIVAPKGQQLSYELPDGSAVQLNAESMVSFQPYWWRFNREIRLKGEAFFEVSKGEKFTVLSEEGTTAVLGTSFNIYARNSWYEVYCKTGKVKVASTKHDIKYQLTAGNLAIIDNKHLSGSKKATDERDYISWTQNKFSFTNTPLQSVFEELERQYDIHIDFSEEVAVFKFGAYFERPQQADQALDLVCMQFQLNFEKTGTRRYKIY